MVGRRFVMEWQMVWQEILIGFSLAGLIAVFLPRHFWRALFLTGRSDADPGDLLVVLENALVAPLVAGATFIGSMGNIPLATVLASGGVMFAGIMGFIYSDLMVPPLVKINARYYGWRVALYIATIMYASIVITAVTMHYAFLLAGLTPESTREVADTVQFRVDYTPFMNIGATLVVAIMLWLARRRPDTDGDGRDVRARWSIQDWVTAGFIALLAGGMLAGLLR